MKRIARLVLTQPCLVRVAFSVTQRIAPIFMLHRFRDEEVGNSGHDPQLLRDNLSWLRSNNCWLLSLTDLLDRLAAGAPLKRAIAFTVDDGYADFARIAAPIFAEFDCPVTVFLTTGFVDGHQWMWWDRVAVALAALRREAEVDAMINSLKLIPESDKLERIDKLVQASGLELPATPPSKFAPIAWEDVRRLARNGVTFGPHTVTHPVLSRTGAEQSQFEIAQSWHRVREEAGPGAVPIFCYPNGELADFGAREESSIARAGMHAALTTSIGYASRRDFSSDRPSARMRLPRFGYAEDKSSFIQIASGIEHCKTVLRATISRGHS
jgi:peptidoglycan/xylan/chitin deacetylase (PgdA/CDA1 family)